MCRDGQNSSRSALIKRESAESVFSFEVFTPEFCALLVEEISHFESSPLPKGRPNTMNHHGILLDELLDFEKIIDVLRTDFLQPIASALIPGFEEAVLDSQKVFIVKYKVGEDIDLAYHYDNAEVTLNVCLGSDFEDGQLYFGDVKQFVEEENVKVTYTEAEHVVGRGILHRGLHRHGAMPISFGERYNLIIWMRSSAVRNRLCPMCGQSPELVPVVAGHDGFTQ